MAVHRLATLASQITEYLQEVLLDKQFGVQSWIGLIGIACMVSLHSYRVLGFGSV